MKTYTVYLREIIVTPVIIEANSIDEAEAEVMQGNGDYQNDKSTPSDICASEYINLLEKPTELKNNEK